MKRGIICSLLCWSGFIAIAQDAPVADHYQAAAEKINDLVHTKLDVSFDYAKAWMPAKAWITLQPHFYPTDSLRLDAKGMEIKTVALVSGNKTQPLKYDYDGTNLRIKLNKVYQRGQQYTIYIDYIAKPNEVKVKGSAAINDAKGLYFINPQGTEKNKPTQIWTQGETEATSVWCPTIDRPNQKTTEEISMRVPDKYVTLSNGLLVKQQKNNDGTRTDYWKMDLPHAPYLFFMGVGDYAIVKDKYNGKEVSYYVEKQYEPVARKIFGNTPEMMAFYAKITGVDYPWPKYAQITGRDYVSGAMENTTATLHQESAQQDARELVDENRWEGTVAHELFHHWFGDLVTAESWSNLTVNESFADYSESLWNEYKYGKDAGAATNYNGMQGYLSNPDNFSKDLVRFHYADKEDMFDAVSYSKGGTILNMLRNYLGDSAFFNGLNVYLTNNKFKAAEAHQLRLALEQVSGKDLNWFFNQWYFGAGHPKLTINYVYDDAAGKLKLLLKQTQEDGAAFRLPMAVDIYESGKKTRYQVIMENKIDSFEFSYKKHPNLVNVDADKVITAEKNDDKTLEEYAFQYKEAGNYVDRREAIEFAAAQQSNALALDLLRSALKDKFHGLRKLTLDKLDMKTELVKLAMEKTIADLATNDPNKLVKAKAIELLGEYKKADYLSIFQKGVKDSSYSVAGASLQSLSTLDKDAAVAICKQMLTQPLKGKLLGPVAMVSALNGIDEALPPVLNSFKDMGLSQEKLDLLEPVAILLARSNNVPMVKEGVNQIVTFRDAIPQAYQAQLAPFINDMILQGIVNAKAKASGPEAKELADYIKMKKETKKAF